MGWLDDYLTEKWGPKPKQVGPKTTTFGPFTWYEWNNPFVGYTDFTGYEAVDWVDPVKWRDFMAAVYGINPGCATAGMLLEAVQSHLSSMRAMDRELDDNINIQKSLAPWRKQLAFQQDRLDVLEAALAAADGDASVCWMNVAIPLLYGAKTDPGKMPPPMIAAVILQNQIHSVVDFGAELSQQSVLTDSLVAAETELSRSAPGEDPTIGDALAKAREHVDDFMGDPWKKVARTLYVTLGVAAVITVIAIAIYSKK